MSHLHVIVPSRSRPHTVAELTDVFRATCTPAPAGRSTRLTFAVDIDDPQLTEYAESGYHLQSLPDEYDWNLTYDQRMWPTIPNLVVVDPPSQGMTAALNQAVNVVLTDRQELHPAGIMFMGDDHRPRTQGWDTAILDGLTKAAIVYGNDLLQGANLPTQAAIRTEVIRALGWMAPPTLKHLYVDNAWLSLGQASESLLYLPEVIIEHMHPVAGKAEWDDGYARVNAPEIDSYDRNAYTRYVSEQLPGDVQRIKAILGHG